MASPLETDPPRGFEVLEHPADIGIHFWGETMAEAFVQAALAFRHLVGEGPVRPIETVTIAVEGRDRLELLFNWLSEILIAFDAEQLLLDAFAISTISDTALTAVARGERFDPSRHETPYYVKAVTYHQMALAPKEGGWHGQVYFDI